MLSYETGDDEIKACVGEDTAVDDDDDGVDEVDAGFADGNTNPDNTLMQQRRCCCCIDRPHWPLLFSPQQNTRWDLVWKHTENA